MDKVSQASAIDIASKLFSRGFTPIFGGRNNWVFESNGSILTIPRHSRVKDYRVRVSATQFLESQGIPVAKILEHFPGNDFSPEYLIVRKVKGEIIDLSVLTDKERSIVHQSAGELLRRIHSISSKGYGRLSDNLVGEYNSWIGFADSYFDESLRRVRSSKWLFHRYGHLLQEEYLKGRKRLLDFDNPFFLHADFHLGNLLFDNLRVSAVLDLDLVTSGDPSWDRGHYCHTFNFDRRDGVNSFRAGYGSMGDIEMERMYSLMIWTRKIGSQVIQRPEALKESVLELNKIIQGQI